MWITKHCIPWLVKLIFPEPNQENDQKWSIDRLTNQVKPSYRILLYLYMNVDKAGK
jgi:hypothetical protein